MSQIAIILSVVFVATVAHGSEWSASLSAVQFTASEEIKVTVFELQEKQNATKKVNRQIAKKLSDGATKSSLDTANDIFVITQKVGAETSKLAKNAKGVDISECLQYPDHLNVTAKSVILKMSECFAEKFRTGLDQIVSISHVFEDYLAKLNAIKEEAQHCSDNIQNEKSADEAVLCIEEARPKATSISQKMAAELIVKNAALDSFSKSFDQLLATCKTRHEFLSFHEESSTVVEKTNKCIQQRTNEAQN